MTSYHNSQSSWLGWWQRYDEGRGPATVSNHTITLPAVRPRL